MCGVKIENKIKQWLKDVMSNKDITSFEVEVVGGTEKGDGYLGEITFVKINGVTNSGVNKVFNFVLKTGKDSKELREQTPIKEAYDNEIYFYEKVYPVFKKFQLERNVEEPFCCVPKCVTTFTHNEVEVLVLENLKKSGFELHNKYKPMSLEHLKMIFTQYGKLHAISFAMKEQQPETFKSLSKNFHNVIKELARKGPMMEGFGSSFRETYAILEESNNHDMVTEYKKLEKEIGPTLVSLSHEENPYAVITHGDCWNNNFMFKYAGLNKDVPTDVRIIDWQISKLASPVYDLSYCLYMCAVKETLDHFDELLQTYHSSFSSFLRQLGSDPQKLFPYTKLLEEWKKYSKYGIILMPFILKFVLCESEDAPDLTSSKDLSGISAFKLKDKHMYDERIRDVARHYVERGFI